MTVTSTITTITATRTAPRRRARRKTAAEKAHRLPDNHFLRHPIAGRIKVEPDSGPTVLMQQLDDLSNWEALKVAYPEFPVLTKAPY